MSALRGFDNPLQYSTMKYASKLTCTQKDHQQVMYTYTQLSYVHIHTVLDVHVRVYNGYIQCINWPYWGAKKES